MGYNAMKHKVLITWRAGGLPCGGRLSAAAGRGGACRAGRVGSAHERDLSAMAPRRRPLAGRRAWRSIRHQLRGRRGKQRLNGDELSEGFLSDMVGAARHPARAMAMESLYEYGSRAGFWRLHRLFTERGLPVTVLAWPRRWNKPEAVEAMLKADWEVPATAIAGSTTNMCPRRSSASISPGHRHPHR
jgi:hypothetical protein